MKNYRCFFLDFTHFVRIFELRSKIFGARFEKYRSKLRVSRSLVRIFELRSKISGARFEKYRSKLRVSRSLVTIFEVNLE